LPFVRKRGKSSPLPAAVGRSTSEDGVNSSAPLAGKVFVVTGGGGALAHAIVTAFAAAGARLAIADRSAERAAAAAAAVSGLALAIDLGSLEGAREMARQVEAGLGPLDGVIHTVGGFAMGPLEQASDADYDRMFDLNLRALFHVIRATVPALRARGQGFVAGIASLPAKTGASPGSALYGAAKSAVATLLRSLDGELAGTDVAVTVCYPMGTIDTELNRRDMPAVDPAGFIDPDEIAAALLFAATRGPRGRVPELAIYPRRSR
jgi:NADP-dependent 3-hydroxy acid dehydrogenase YdfG